MPVSIKKITLWRKEIQNQPGSLAAALDPLATAGASLQVVMGYRYPGDTTKAAVELYPVTGKKTGAAAQAAGLAAFGISALLVEGSDKPGTGALMAKNIADAGINVAFFVAQVIGRKYSVVLGFDSEDDVKKASAIIRKSGSRKK
jgi:hypothetical protein